MEHPTKKALDVLAQMHDKGVVLWLDGDQIRYRAPSGTVTDTEKRALRELKSEIVSLLSLSQSDVTRSSILGHTSSFKLIPFTFQQKWLWSLMAMDSNSNFSCNKGWRIEGPLDVSRLSDAVCTITRKNEILRTTIDTSEATPRQKIENIFPVELNISDLSPISRDELEASIEQVVMTFSSIRLESINGSLFRCLLITLSDREYILLAVLHHLITDGISLELLSRDLWSEYENQHQVSEPEYKAPTSTYAEYALWQQSTRLDWDTQHRPYWVSRLTGASVIKFPRDSPKYGSSPIAHSQLCFSLDETVSAELTALSRKERRPVSLVLAALYCALVFRETSQTDFVLPFNIAGRQLSSHVDTLGYFAHLLLLRIVVTQETSFLDLLKLISDEFSVASQHADCGRIALDRPDLCAGTFFQWSPLSPATSPRSIGTGGSHGISVHDYSLKKANSNVTPLTNDIVLTFFESQGQIHVSGYYRSDIFRECYIDAIAHQFVLISEFLVSHPLHSISTPCKNS
jgi:hypothetical protein